MFIIIIIFTFINNYCYMCSSIASCYSSFYTPLDSSGVPKTQLFYVRQSMKKGSQNRIQYLYKNAFYALPKSRFEYESVLSEDVYA